MWRSGKQILKLALLHEEVNKISNETIEQRIILPTLYDLDIGLADTTKGGLKLNVSNILANTDMSEVASIAVISTVEINDITYSGARYFVIARNVSDLDDVGKKADWYISNIDISMFEHQ
ncbi:MAG: hypothetical protein LBU60_01950 [Clostridiales bacterium]|jgi:hypothetical protein|nr:hypothetical protein [Clostridiales bacterium]